MKQNIKELADTVSAIEMQIRIIRSNLQNPEMVFRRIEERELLIAKAYKEIEDLRSSINDGPAQIESLKGSLRLAKEALQQAKDAAPPTEEEKQVKKIDKKIEKLLQLKAELERLQNA